MENVVKKYKLYIELEREGSVIKIDDIVNNPFNLDDYIFEHNLESYTIIKFDLEAIKEW